MPRREVHIRLYQLVLFCAALVATFTAGITLLEQTIHREQRNTARIVAVRNEQIHGLRLAAITSCTSRHKLSRSQRAQSGALVQFLKRTLAPIRPGTKFTRQQRIALMNLRVLERGLERADAKAGAADCTRIPRIPPAPVGG